MRGENEESDLKYVFFFILFKGNVFNYYSFLNYIVLYFFVVFFYV